MFPRLGRAGRTALAAVLLAALATPIAHAAGAATSAAPPASASVHSLTLDDGSVVHWSDDGTGTLTRKDGTTRAFPVPGTPGRSGLGEPISPTAALLQRRADALDLTPYDVGTATGGAESAVRPQTMNSGAVPLPKSVRTAVKGPGGQADKRVAAPDGLPANQGLATSFQSYLNSGGVNAVGAFQDTATQLDALPGKGQIVTNVSLGDLTDRGMADAGDGYVRAYGPTTVLKDGRRYLDYPSLPLIPTYTSDAKGHLDPAGATEGQDPNLAEVLLDFSMMAPLPHDRQRPEATGSGVTDLLGIAPGAQYRLVVPEEASAEGIATALRAAAAQKPRPDVITASLGFGTDGSIGFPSRWLEDDPTIRDTLRSIVDSGIVVVVSSNDGTRLGLPVSVGPDGGSTPTNVTSKTAAQTSIDDVAPTTTPSLVRDTGVIAAGGTTVDDTLTSDDTRTAVYPTTRYNGSAGYSSGFGSRVDLAAPGDNLPSLIHTADGPSVVLNGGTSASAPMIAAAAANVLAAAEATGQRLSPRQVRDLLVDTGRPLARPPQADQDLHMGPQLDVTAAVEKVLSRGHAVTPSAVRLSVAERQLLSVTPTTSFVEATDPDAIDLSGPGGTGQNAVSPITFGLDLTGAHDGLTYRLRVDGKGTTIPATGPSLRVLPRELLDAAGLPLVSSEPRGVRATFEALDHGRVVASASRTLTFSASDGRYVQPQAPSTPGSAPLGKPVTVHYDLTGLRDATDPELVLSSVGHWTPFTTSDKFRAQWRTRLTGTKGSVTIPATAFAPGGAGLYGVGITLYDGQVFGDFRALRVGPDADQRPSAPLLGQGGTATAHAVELTRADGGLTVSWDTRSVPHADGAAIEFLTPAPTLYGALNTATNQNGSGRDDNGVDHASTLLRLLPSAKGRTVLDLESLGLPTGLQYPVRILATRDGKPVGQASPTSFVQYLDGDTVSGVLENFEVKDGTALLATDDFAEGDDGGISLRGGAVTAYSLADGRLGREVSHESGTSMMQMVVGADPSTGHTLVAHRPFAGGVLPEVDLRDTATGTEVRLSTLDPGTGSTSVYYQGGVVDPAHHRAAVLTFDGVTGVANLWTVDMTTGEVSPPLPLNQSSPGRAFSNVSVDASTGTFFVATTGTLGPCLSGRVPYAAVSVDPGSREVSPLTTMPACTAGLLPDGKGDRVYVAAGAATPNYVSGEFPTSSWRSADQKTLTTSTPADLGTRGVMWPVLDTEHHLALVASLYEEGTTGDNNALSEITVVDPDTGAVLARHPIANLVNSTLSTSNFDFTSRRGLFLDPGTRSGYLVNPWADGLERFTY
ncbi:S8 family serine peptidase [Streptomyces brasiliensis]|uniref:S8 family serine peptidase n=1 Tax=Streptomyces brasiliensis TaxID=1954 RepID=UPI001670720A|nr:S8 family serine peptidase [Streptomyces brasiliensis]